MAYSIPEIIVWSKISQPLARIGEAKKRATNNGSIDKDLDIELYLTRKDVEYEYGQDTDSSNLYAMGNYLLALCGVYLFQAQETVVGGGTITPIIPRISLDPYDFEVSASSFIATGETSKVIAGFVGFNLLFVRNNVTQSTVNQGGTYYSWSKLTGLFTLINGAAQGGELFQIYPV